MQAGVLYLTPSYIPFIFTSVYSICFFNLNISSHASFMAVNSSTLHERLNVMFQAKPVTNQIATIAIQGSNGSTTS